jgi:hypothetical protein
VNCREQADALARPGRRRARSLWCRLSWLSGGHRVAAVSGPDGSCAFCLRCALLLADSGGAAPLGPRPGDLEPGDGARWVL